MNETVRFEVKLMGVIRCSAMEIILIR